jgi:hypothetical protein
MLVLVDFHEHWTYAYQIGLTLSSVKKQTAGGVSLAAVVSTTAMRHQYYVQH